METKPKTFTEITPLDYSTPWDYLQIGLPPCSNVLFPPRVCYCCFIQGLFRIGTETYSKRMLNT